MVDEDDVVMEGAADSKPAAQQAPPARLQPWVEKYRPKTVDDVAHQDEVTNTLKGAIATGVLPHLLFYGPPGTGKTSTVLALARTLFGPDTYRDRILELNASDERGIKVVREKIKTFAQVAVGRATHQAGYPCPPFKVIILDEADTMTPDAQSALRRTMETYSTVTRFCLICNYVTRIIEPLASRCAKFRFSALGQGAMLDRLSYISREEDVKITADGLQAIVDLSGGDMRKAVTAMQSASQFYAGAEVTPEVLVDIAGKIPAEVKDALWSAIKSGSYNKIVAAVDDFMSSGYPLSTLLEDMQEATVADTTIPDHKKADICRRIAEADRCLIDGCNEELQLLDLASVAARSCCSQ
ncbi:unnamed protein product [Ectocarpus sp. 12 AP-2014]